MEFVPFKKLCQFKIPYLIIRQQNFLFLLEYRFIFYNSKKDLQRGRKKILKFVKVLVHSPEGRTVAERRGKLIQSELFPRRSQQCPIPSPLLPSFLRRRDKDELGTVTLDE